MNLIDRMKNERAGNIRGLYWKFQIMLAYHSNKIEGSRLSSEQTQYIFDENKIIVNGEESVNVDDVVETKNHFKAFDYILDNIGKEITIASIKKLHFLLKSNTSDEDNPLTPIGEFKKVQNVIGAFNPVKITEPEKVPHEMKTLLAEYLSTSHHSLENIVDFHYKFERIHPFADGNGRVGRLIVFKECLKNEIIPAMILDDYREYYLMGLDEYGKGMTERLLETFRAGQDSSQEILDEFGFKEN